jgi:hypothetical protein
MSERKEKLPKINLPYIRKVLRFIERGPKLRFNMRTYHDHVDPKDHNAKELRVMRYPSCGTKACFAGWAVMLQRKPEGWADVEYSTVAAKARQLLGFTEVEGDIVFAGEGCNYSTIAKQLSALKHSLREVLRGRGIKAKL